MRGSFNPFAKELEMLVLSRQRDESVMIGDHTEVRVVDVRGDKVRLGFIAPREVSVHRKEVYDQIRRENEAAAKVVPEDLRGLRPPAPRMRLVPAPLPADAHTKEDESFLRAALDEAKASMAEDGVPIGAILVRGGQIVARGRDRSFQNNDPTAHAEIECLRSAGRQADLADATLYSTLLPCFLCSGAVVQLGVRRVVIGDAVNYAGTNRPGGSVAGFLRNHAVELVDTQDAECAALLAGFVRDNPDAWNR